MMCMNNRNKAPLRRLQKLWLALFELGVRLIGYAESKGVSKLTWRSAIGGASLGSNSGFQDVIHRFWHRRSFGKEIVLNTTRVVTYDFLG